MLCEPQFVKISHMLCFDHPREIKVTVSLYKQLSPTAVYDSKIRSMFLGHSQSVSARAMLEKSFKMPSLFLTCYGNSWHVTSKEKIQVTSVGCSHVGVWIKNMQQGTWQIPVSIQSLLWLLSRWSLPIIKGEPSDNFWDVLVLRKVI